jgi:hypothetical protein
MRVYVVVRCHLEAHVVDVEARQEPRVGSLMFSLEIFSASCCDSDFLGSALPLHPRSCVGADDFWTLPMCPPIFSKGSCFPTLVHFLWYLLCTFSRIIVVRGGSGGVCHGGSMTQTTMHHPTKRA